ncbi:hypothetical protein D3C85_1727510 [compost metagenome]
MGEQIDIAHLAEWHKLLNDGCSQRQDARILILSTRKASGFALKIDVRPFQVDQLAPAGTGGDSHVDKQMQAFPLTGTCGFQQAGQLIIR